MKLRPLHDRVLVEPLEAEEKTAGGIIAFCRSFFPWYNTEHRHSTTGETSQ